MFEQIIYLLILLFIGYIILFLRRKAKGGKSLYKIALILLGIVLATVFSEIFDSDFLKSVSIVLLIVILFELSSRLTPNNTTLSNKSLVLFSAIIFANMVLITIISHNIIGLSIINSIILGIMISTIEYFMVSELKEEGDMSSPFLLVMTVLTITFIEVTTNDFFGIIEFIKYLVIGLGTGIIFGIIVFKSIKSHAHNVNWVHELGLVCAAIIIYIIAEYINGSGIIAVLVFGIFFGNSYVKKRTEINGLSPFIFKSTETLILLLLGFLITTHFSISLLWKTAIVFLAYIIIRLTIISIAYKRHSFHNRLLLTFAPKGIVFAISMLVIAQYAIIENNLLDAMFIILIISLLCASFFEYIEYKKIAYFDRVYEVLKKIRFGRKRDLWKNWKK